MLICRNAKGQRLGTADLVVAAIFYRFCFQIVKLCRFSTWFLSNASLHIRW